MDGMAASLGRRQVRRDRYPHPPYSSPRSRHDPRSKRGRVRHGTSGCSPLPIRSNLLTAKLSRRLRPLRIVRDQRIACQRRIDGRHTMPTVIEGDAIRVANVSIRLVDFDAPELFHPRCPAEYRPAVQARDALQVVRTKLQLTLVPCTSNYGRLCALAVINGAPVAQTMVAGGLASPYTCHYGCAPKRDWCHN